ncbi:MAG: DUF6476 family protein [Albidovulum sp.]|nr:DUF6476 family protein [Albidovulum sp.]MDE0305055.1 DUF6476 family protein [Albidovulum sp.]MDE0532831.1 DUF6476 family protein [Albidovulum sp.]
MADAPKIHGDPANLRVLRYLVTAMTIVFIVGFSIVVVLVYLQFVNARNGFESNFPDFIELPEGVEAQSFTRGNGWHAVVTQDDKILIFESASGKLTKSVDIR